MKKGLVLIAALSVTLLTTGCGWMTCNKDAKATEKTAKPAEKAVEKTADKAVEKDAE